MIKIKMVNCEACGGSGHQPAPETGPLLKAERLRLGVAVRQLERAMDISRTYLIDMEKGSRRMSLRLARLYQERLEALSRNGHAE